MVVYPTGHHSTLSQAAGKGSRVENAQVAREGEEKKEGASLEKAKNPVVVWHAFFPCTYVCMRACTHLRMYLDWVVTQENDRRPRGGEGVRGVTRAKREKEKKVKKKKELKTVCEPQPRPHREIVV